MSLMVLFVLVESFAHNHRRQFLKYPARNQDWAEGRVAEHGGQEVLCAKDPVGSYPGIGDGMSAARSLTGSK
jgi:hypothetical protein